VTSTDLVALGLVALQAGFVLIMVVYLISGLDDLVIDVLFFVLFAARRFERNCGHHQPSLEELEAAPEQPFALMFPAWQEADVIRRALMKRSPASAIEIFTCLSALTSMTLTLRTRSRRS
jgi:hypothetical protein